MKAKIIETGEEINIIGISKEWGTAQYYGNDGIYHQRTFNDKEIEILDTSESTIDWEQRRYEIRSACAPTSAPWSSNTRSRIANIQKKNA